MNKLLAIVLVLAASVAISQAVKCYVCTSAGDSGCGDPFKNNNFATDCASAKGCYKSKSEVGGVNVITRTCGTGADTGCKSVSLLGISSTTCSCTGENCNSAGYAKVSLVALIATVVVPFALFH